MTALETPSVQRNRFSSLETMRATHASLLERMPEDNFSDAHISEVKAFLANVAATGAVLDNPGDRKTAQGLLDYWRATLYSVSRDVGGSQVPSELTSSQRLKDAVLAPFAPETLRAVEREADRWLDADPAVEPLVRRIILRLLRLRDDNTFELVSATDAVFEDLEPKEDVAKALAKLAALGIVRISADSLGAREITLRSPDFLNSWLRLKGWKAERLEFRQKAMDWEQKRLKKEGDAANKPFLRRAEEAAREVVHKVGGWIEGRWRALLVLCRFRCTSDEFLTDREYEEAETYRDRNQAELRLIYQKRQFDRVRSEKRQSRTFAFAFSSIVFAFLSGIAIWGWIAEGSARSAFKEQYERADQNHVQQVKANEKIERLRQEANLLNSYWQLTKVAEAHRGKDIADAFLWSAAAWSLFEANADVLDVSEREWLRTSHLLRLGVHKRQLPILSGMAYQEDGPIGTPRSVAAVSSDGEVALTAGIEKHGEELTLVIITWRAAPGGSWQQDQTKTRRPLLKDNKSLPSRVLRAYVSSDGQAAVVAVSRDKEGDLYLLTITENGLKVDREVPFDEVLGEAKFSPDGKYFGVITSKVEKAEPPPGGAGVAASQRKSTVSVREVKGWNPHPLGEALVNGTAGGLTFSRSKEGEPVRVAVVLGSDSPHPRTFCLEWLLGEMKPPPQPRAHETPDPVLQRTVPEDEVLVAAYGPPEQPLLFVARGHAKENRGRAWLVETRQHPDAKHPAVRNLSDEWKHAGPVTQAAFNPWGDRLVTASDDGGVVLWTLSQRRPELPVEARAEAPVTRHEGKVLQVDFSPDGGYLVTASRDKRALVQDANSGVLIPLWHSGSVGRATFTPDGRRVLTVSQSAVYRWELPWADAQPLHIDIPRGEVRRTLLTESLERQGEVLAAGGGMEPGSASVHRGWARVWDTANGAPRTPEIPHHAPVRHIAISPRDPFLVCTTSNDGTVRLWNNQGSLVWEEPACDERAVFTTFGDDGQQLRLLVLARDNTQVKAGRTAIRIYRIDATGAGVQEMKTADCAEPLTAAVFSPRCERVVAYSGDGGDGRGLAVVWDLNSPEPRPLRQTGAKFAHREPIVHATFNHDGSQLVTASRDDTAMVWTWKDSVWEGEELRFHTADLNCASFDPKGNRVLTASTDGNAIIWQRQREGESYRYHVQYRLGTNSVGMLWAVFIDDHLVLTASADNVVRVWDTATNCRLVAARTNAPTGRLAGSVGYRKEGKGAGRVMVLGRDERRLRYAESEPDGQPRAVPSRPESLLFTLTEWPLAPLDKLKETELLAAAKLTAARQIAGNDPASTDPLLLDEAFNLWPQRGSQLTPPEPSPEELLSWHLRAATQYELTGHWRGTLWHWNEVIDDPQMNEQRHWWLVRRARVLAELRDWAGADEDYLDALQVQEQDAELLRTRSETLVRHAHSLPKDAEQRRKKLNEAIRSYQSLLQHHATDQRARFALARLHLEVEDLQSAVKELDRLLDADPKNPDLLLLRATTLKHAKVARFVDAFQGYVKAGREFKARGRLLEAEPALRNALELTKTILEVPDAERARVHFELGEMVLAKGTMADAKNALQNHFEFAVKHDPKVPEYWVGLARCHERLRQWQEAVAAFDEALKLKPNDIPVSVSRAEALIRLPEPQWDKAAEAYRAIVAREPKVVSHHLRLATALIEQKKWAEAAKAYEALIPLLPQSVSHRVRLAELYLQPAAPGQVFGAERLQEASRYLAEAVELARDSSDESLLWTRLAIVQLAAGKTEEYRATRARMMEQFAGTATETAANNVAWVAAFAENTPASAARAVNFVKPVVAAHPANANYRNTHGAALFRAGRRTEAIEELRKATELRAQPTNYLSPEERAYGDAFDQLFTAMAQYAPAQPGPARESLRKAIQLVDSVKTAWPSESREQSLTRIWERLEFEVVRREAERLINP